MSILKKINTKADLQDNSGFNINSASSAGRFVNKNGSPNLVKKGIPIWKKYSMYHSLLQMSAWKFILIIFLVYIGANVLFGGIYYLVGIEHLNGAIVTQSELEKFGTAFFFSIQTFTTVGYGHVSPLGFWTSSIAALEALFGLMTLAIVTSLFYGRFARPKAYLKFSHIAVIAPYKGIEALMFRVAPYKNNYLIDAETKVSVAMKIEEDGKTVNRFYNLPLEMTSINNLSLSWTIVHPLNEKSPFYNFSQQDYLDHNIEIIINLKAFDEMFSNVVVSRNSYTADEIVFNARFQPMFYPDETRTTTILDLGKINAIEKM